MTKSTDARATSDLDAGWLASGMRPAIATILGEVATIHHRMEGRLAPGVARGLERVAHGAAVLDRLVGDLHDLAMADAGRFDLRLEHVDLGALVTDAIYNAMAQADRARVALELHATVVATVDPPRVLRTLATVLHHAATTGLTTTPIVVRLERRVERAHITITDFGPGMTTEQAGLLRRGRITGAQPGLSIGFYVGRKVIEAHGGRMCVDTVPGRGSRISVELPVRT